MYQIFFLKLFFRKIGFISPLVINGPSSINERFSHGILFEKLCGALTTEFCYCYIFELYVLYVSLVAVVELK